MSNSHRHSARDDNGLPGLLRPSGHPTVSMVAAQRLDAARHAEILHFFALLYPGVNEGYLILSWPSPTRRHKDGRVALDSRWHNLATTSLAHIAARAATLSAARSVYFGVAVQHPSRQPNPFQRSQNASAYVMPGLYFDLDLASGAHAASTLPATEAEALAFLAALPAKPSLILHTGGGLHAYWLFAQPLWLRTDDERKAAARLQHAFAKTLCQQGKAHDWTLDDLRDLARVLRPPGTMNHKYGVPVTVIEDRPERYTEADFTWLQPLPAPSVTQEPGAGVHDQPSLLQVIEAYGGTLTQKSAEEWHGAHPAHGSSTGVNLDVNLHKGLWHCWRHSTGGDALSLLAVCEGLVACEDVQPGALGGYQFVQVLDLARLRLGWSPPARPVAPAHAQQGTATPASDPVHHVMPSHLQNHHDPSVRLYWTQLYRRTAELKQRLFEQGLL